MKLKGNIIICITLLHLCFMIGFIDARSSSLRRNSFHRGNKGKRTWSSEPSVNNNAADSEVKLSEDTFLGQSQTKSTSNAGAGSNSNSNSKTPTVGTNWLELEGIPPNRVSVRLHSDLTLHCEAVGSPPPMIYWLKNGIPLDSALPYSSEEVSNHVDRSGLTGSGVGDKVGFIMSKVKSKLPLQCIRPEDEAQYTCVADNNGRQVIATTEVVIEEDDPSEEIRPECEYKLPMFYSKKQRKGTPAYISASESLHMENIGNDIVLPCRAGGRPRPKVSWIDTDGQPIVSGKRFQVNSNGNLLIRNLRWKDMGEFSCVVDNPFGSDVASTFVYPLMTEGT